MLSHLTWLGVTLLLTVKANAASPHYVASPQSMRGRYLGRPLAKMSTHVFQHFNSKPISRNALTGISHFKDKESFKGGNMEH